MTIYINVNGEDIEATGSQLEELLATQASMQAVIAQQEAQEQVKQSAVAKLTALGLTADEVNALLGVSA
jgi:predicted XRE-type DNA-binding protein